MIQRLRWKFVFINMLIVSAILSALCVVMVVATHDSLRQDSLSLLYQAASEQYTFTWPFEPEPYREDVTLPYFTVLVGRNGVTTLLENHFGAVADSEQLLTVVRDCLKQPAESGVLSAYQLRYLRLSSAAGWRIAFADISQEQRTIRSLIFHLICIGGATLVIFFLISLLLARWAVHPVEQSWAQQRQFVSDASHELKTPLTIILSNVDMLQNHCQTHDASEQRWLDNIRASSRQMSQLVEELLTLARSDNLAAKDRLRETVNLSDLVAEEALIFEPVLFEAGKTLRDELAENVFVTGDPSKLHRLVQILLDNARKYADSPSTVLLRLQPEGSRRVRLSLRTEGEPIAPEARAHLFERFYRADQARSSEGFGLGLSIAEQIVREHEGRIWAESGPEQCNTFFVSLPVKKS